MHEINTFEFKVIGFTCWRENCSDIYDGPIWLFKKMKLFYIPLEVSFNKLKKHSFKKSLIFHSPLVFMKLYVSDLNLSGMYHYGGGKGMGGGRKKN